MNDYINELQLKAMEIIQREGLAAEFNKYVLRKSPYQPCMRYSLVDFIIQYTEIQANTVINTNTI